jgi:undecaprenyl-diphosphatase
MANNIIDWIAALDGWLLWLAVFGLAAGESAVGLDFVVPGEVGMVVGGAAGQRAGVALWLLVLAATLGSLLGDQISYQLGRRFGVTLIDRWSWTREHVAPQVDRAREHFERRGGATVFVARWVGALRAVVPFVAGTAAMPLGRFLAWDLLGAVSWSATVVTLGYVFGRSITDLVDRFGLVISIAVVGGLALWWATRRLRARRGNRNGTEKSSPKL